MSKVNANDVFGVLKRHILADGFDVIMDLDESKGSWIIDKRNGKRYLDLFTMYASASIGYNHPHVVAHQDTLGRLAVNKPTISDIYNVDYAHFLETFSRVGIPDYLPRTFFISGGALAVENALKAAFDWKVRKNMARGIEGKGHQVIHFEQAFHGRSGYTMSITNTDPVKTMYFPQFKWPRIVNPKMYFPVDDNTLKTTIVEEDMAMKQIHKALTDNPHDIAAIIIEPIQGEGGDNHFRKEFLQKLRDVCDQEEMLLIFDEVQTGVGLTGKFWSHEHFGVQPDVMSFGKKSQVCGVLAGKRIEEVDDHVFAMSSRINSTFGGNLIDMVRFGYILEVIEKESLVDHAAKMGNTLKSALQGLAEEFPELVSNVRGLGLMAAFDLPNPEKRNMLRQKMMEEGVIILGCGSRTIRFRPHLNISEEEIGIAVSKIRNSLAAMSVSTVQ